MKNKEYMPSVVGNAELKRRLCSAVLEGTTSHAYILEGAEGSGKMLVAMMCAAALSCERRGEDGVPLPCGECDSCRKILNGKSPDITVIEKESDKATISVDRIRTVINDTVFSPNDNDVKVYIIKHAQQMNKAAQNALLKTIEEPPEYVMFFLLADSAETILETVKSRAPILRMELFSSEKIDKYLLSGAANQKARAAAELMRTKSAKDYAELLTASGGAIGLMYRLLEDGDLKKKTLRDRACVIQLFGLFSRTGENNRETTRKKAELLAGLSARQDRDELCSLMVLIKTTARDLSMLKESEECTQLCFFSDRDEALEMSEGITRSKLLTVYDRADSALFRFSSNANIKLTVYGFFTETGLI